MSTLPRHLYEELLAKYSMARFRRRNDVPGLLICPLEGCVTPARHQGVQCPSHCTNISCPGRKKRAPLIPWLRLNMATLQMHLPPHPPPLSNRRPLLLITTTFPSEQQLIRLQHLTAVLADEPDCFWVVVEDASAPSANVSALLKASARVPYTHLAFGPTRRGGNAQRNLALQHIRAQRLEGVVYNLDDDNAYHPRLWNELRALLPGRVGVLAVRRAVYPPPLCDGRFLPLLPGERRLIKVERPVYDNATGSFLRFDAGWCREKSWMTRKYGRRTFCVDMGGFAFDAALLRQVRGDTLWEFKRHGGGESELIQKLLPGGAPEDLQPLGNCGRDVFVFHNEWRVLPVPMLEPSTGGPDGGHGPARCGAKTTGRELTRSPQLGVIR